jgi:CRP-like cAMP-binding protein
MTSLRSNHPAPRFQNDLGEAAPEQLIIQYISQFVRLSQEDISAIMETTRIRMFKKGTILLREGQMANLCYFNLKGCVRQYYLLNGLEKTTNFYTEGEPIAPNEGSAKNQPSRFYLACVEDCLLSVGSPEDETRFFQKFPKFEAICRAVLEEQLLKSQENFAAFMINTPEERYLALLQERPDLLDRVPQYQLASYLGIQPESLSRIRKRIMLK